MKWEPFAAIFALVAIGGCARPIRAGAVIDRYRRAECIPVTLSSPSAARMWNYILKMPEGWSVKVKGTAVPGGNIEVTYPSGKDAGITADAGDYIYPADVRLDRANEHLYVKADGTPAAFGRRETWLLEIDLPQRRQVQKVRVEPSVLPEECPASTELR